MSSNTSAGDEKTNKTVRNASSSQLDKPLESPRNFRLGHYVFGKTLGTGTFGKVKLAEHEITGHKVAVKILNKRKLQSERMEKKIAREIKILKLLRHPNIIRLYEVIETATDIIMVMEYISGGELFEFIIKNWPLSQDIVRYLFQQLICAVEHSHYFRVVHRDLKPENVLVNASDHSLKVADFGLSNMFTDGDFLATSCGSPNYAAPEVVSGRLYAGPEVDVWSCGVILYAMLCGRLPFDADSVPVLFKKIQSGRFSIPNHLPEKAIDLLSKILVVDQLKRITITEIREHDWFKEDIPKYLSVSPFNMSLSQLDYDDEILKIVAKKLSIPLDIAIKLLALGTKTEASVAYFMLLDLKKKKKPTRTSPTVAPSSPLNENCLTPLQSCTAMDKMLDITERTTARQSYNMPSLLMPSDANPIQIYKKEEINENSIRGKATYPTHQHWRLGLLTYQSCSVIIMNVYNVLKESSLEWRAVRPFKLACRLINTEEDLLVINIYRLVPMEKIFLVDITLAGGDSAAHNEFILPALDIAHTIYLKLAKLLTTS